MDGMVIDDIMNQITTLIKNRFKEEHSRVDDDADNIRILLNFRFEYSSILGFST